MNNLLLKFNSLPQTPKMAVILGVVLLVILVLFLVFRFFKVEGFEPFNSFVGRYAEYPEVHESRGLNGEEIVFDNYFTKPQNEVKPLEKPIAQQKVAPVPAPMEKTMSQAPAPNTTQVVKATTIDVPKMETTVPIDIGNGVSVTATIQVPAQTSDVPEQTAVTEITPPQTTDMEISPQTVTLPAQEGVIPATIEGQTVSVPVSIPEQTVTIEAQNAIIPTIEPFRL